MTRRIGCNRPPRVSQGWAMLETSCIFPSVPVYEVLLIGIFQPRWIRLAGRFRVIKHAATKRHPAERTVTCYLDEF